MANSISSCTKLDIYEGLLLAYIINGPVFFEVLKDGGGQQSKSILVCDINQMGEKVSAKTMAIDDKTGKNGFGNDD